MKVEFLKLSKVHLEMVRNWRNSPQVKKHMISQDYIKKEDQIKWFNRIKNDPTKKYWVVQVDGKYVGIINLTDIDYTHKRCYWGYYIADPKDRGKGIGRLLELNILNYVFDIMGLNKLCGEILSENDFVVKVHQKYGSKIEGTLRQHILQGDKFHDIITIGILKEEWDKIKDKFDYEIYDFQ